jgi:hypothetical protein
MIPSAILSKKTLTFLINDFAADKTRNQAKYDPADDTHVRSSFGRTHLTAHDCRITPLILL